MPGRRPRSRRTGWPPATPATASEVVVGGGSPALVGHRVQVTTAEGTSTYTVAGVTAPVWFEHAIFFTDAAAARISPPIDAVVAYGPPGAVRRAVGRGVAQVLTGAGRKQADPDPSGGRDQLFATGAASTAAPAFSASSSRCS